MEISILFLPLIASIISGFFGKIIGDRNSEIVTSLLVSISALLSIFVSMATCVGTVAVVMVVFSAVE